MPITYQQKKADLERNWNDGEGQLRLAKSTISNLFRYQPRGAPARRLSLGHFNEVIALDPEQRTLEVEGLTTYETAVSYALERGFLPLVAPELKHITVGGATVGIGIESTCFRYGFVHDGLLEADVLLPSGRVVTCTADNEYADLFAALPNSYGTLGYILRAKIRLHPAKAYVHIDVRRFGDAEEYLDAMREASEAGRDDFVEGLVFEDGRFLLMTGRFRDEVPHVDDILRRDIFYKLVQQRDAVYLRAKDYIFRYDPEWFWNIPETPFHALFRRYAPERCRNSSFYTKYAAFTGRVRQKLPGAREPDTEPLIQDWEVPWDGARELLTFALDNVPLDGRPWAAVPIRTPRRPTLYPIEPNTLYFNLGCYLQVRKPAGKEPYHYTKILDRKCFELGGIKMLYSSSFLGPEEFDARFNGEAYRELKRKYDPDGRAPTLYEKVAFRTG
ncbi:MAG: FAD-binding oxidoreductase [Gammaproteobacteria bacterium]|nr:FAD-binding oxidoreductase [Gammaproteobacteria bacterium]